MENPRFYGRSLNKIQILHRSLSKKRRDSRNRGKARVKLAKAYEKLVDQRDDFLHKLSRFYVDNYDVIAVEDLQIQNMVRNHNLAQKILDASWSKFVEMLLFKAGRAGRVVVKVYPRGTSEGLSLDDPYRDYISACRIKDKAGSGRPSEPVERRPLLLVTAKAVIEGQILSVKQEALPFTVG